MGSGRGDYSRAGVPLMPEGAWMGEMAGFVGLEASADNTKPMFGQEAPEVFLAIGLASAAAPSERA